jgi:hypothetical protein
VTMTANGDTATTPPPPMPRAKTTGQLELPVETIEEIKALQRMRRDKTPHDVVAEGVELLRRTYFVKARGGRPAGS